MGAPWFIAQSLMHPISFAPSVRALPLAMLNLPPTDIKVVKAGDTLVITTKVKALNDVVFIPSINTHWSLNWVPEGPFIETTPCPYACGYGIRKGAENWKDPSSYVSMKKGEEISYDIELKTVPADLWATNYYFPPQPGLYDLIFQFVNPNGMPPYYAYHGTFTCPIYGAYGALAYALTPEQAKGLFEKLFKYDLKELGERVVREMASRFNIPNLKASSMENPQLVAAGEPFTSIQRFYNSGLEGLSHIKMSSPFGGFDQDVQVGRSFDLQAQPTMPWDNLSGEALVNTFSYAPSDFIITGVIINGKEYKFFDIPLVPTDSVTQPINISAGFPDLELISLEAPETMKPGDNMDLIATVRNKGLIGQIGMGISGPGISTEKMVKLPAGEVAKFLVSGSMPPALQCQYQFAPFFLGRNKERVNLPVNTVNITPINALIHSGNKINIMGGYDEGNNLKGFVAGKNIKINGIDTNPGSTLNPFPMDGIFINGDLYGGNPVEITCDELYFIRVQAGREMVIARAGSILEMAAKTYEFSSTVPTLSQGLQSLKSLKTSFSIKPLKVEVKI